MLDVSVVSVVILIIAICDMRRQEFSLCECVLKHDTNFESSFQEELCLIAAQLGDRLKDSKKQAL